MLSWWENGRAVVMKVRMEKWKNVKCIARIQIMETFDVLFSVARSALLAFLLHWGVIKE